MPISAVSISGFKSILAEQRIELAPITIFAGANSAGKSSASQPFLLMKQTLEAPFDPGTILLHGPNVKFTAAKQVFSTSPKWQEEGAFTIRFFDSDQSSLKIHYKSTEQSAITAWFVEATSSSGSLLSYSEGEELPLEATKDFVFQKPWLRDIHRSLPPMFKSAVWLGQQARCFPDLMLFGSSGSSKGSYPFDSFEPPQSIRQQIKNMIHIRGLRGNPERSYFAAARTQGGFPGVFEDYVASILLEWQDRHSKQIAEIGNDLRALGLTWKVRATKIQDTHAEIRVGRLPIPTQGGANDLVSLADVGLGVSQILPFLIALRVAVKGQIVFSEQPEIHLHPRAQFALARIVIAAMKRGVKIWIETHSSIFIRALQVHVAEGEVQSTQLALNWFMRDPNSGWTTVHSAHPDKLGRLGAWPVDFDDVTMTVDRQFLDAVAKARFAEK